MPTQNEILSSLLDKFDRETLTSVIREKGLVAPFAANKSSDCGPKTNNSINIRDVTGDGADPATAMKAALANAMNLGQACCEGGGCDSAKLCKFFKDKWDAAAPVLKDNKWVATGTISGHCDCE